MAKSSNDKRKIAVDVNEFRRTRDALATTFITLSSAIDKAVKAYIEHTDLVIAGDATLNVSQLLEPFNVISKTAQSIAPAQVAKLASAQPPQAADEDADDSKKTEKKKKKRAYKPRDPNAPRRPLTAYFRFLGEVRPVIAAELQRAGTPHKPGDLSVIATERWKNLSQEQHEPYHEAYRRELVKYKADLMDYLERNGIAQGESAGLGQEDDDDVDAAVGDAFGVDAVKSSGALGPQSDSDTDSDTDSDSDDDDDDDDEMIAPPPPPPAVKSRKSSSPETVMKTPKSKSASKAADASRTPMFSSLSNKKRKADGEDAAPAEKKPRGRPPKEKKAK